MTPTSCLARYCLDQGREAATEKHAITQQWLDAQRKEEAGYDCDKHQSRRGQAGIGEKHPEQFLSDFGNDAHRAISTVYGACRRAGDLAQGTHEA